MTALVLGTAQFGMDYGATNREGLIPKNEIEEILSLAKVINLKTLDTAQAYGTSEENLGKFNLENFRVNTKIQILPDKPKTFKLFHEIVLSSLDRLNVKELGTLFIHNPNNLNADNLEIYSEYFLKLKEMNLIKAIGISVYNYSDVNRIYNYFPIEEIQAPFNIFDFNFYTSGWLKKLEKEKISFQARSIFLQGVLLTKLERLPNYFKKFSKHFDLLDSILRDYNLSRIELAFAFLNQFPSINSIVVGVENANQLSSTYEIFIKDKLGFTINFDNFKSIPIDLSDPRLWRLTGKE